MVWAKLDDSYPAHPKLLAAGVEALGFDVAGICYANRYATDGFIAEAAIWAVYPPERDPHRLAARLVEVGRWSRDDEAGGWWIHDFTDYNPTAEHVQDVRAKRREAGQRGGVASGKTRSKQVPPGHDTDEANAKQNAWGGLEANANPDPNPLTPRATEGDPRGSPKSYSPSSAKPAPTGKAKKQEHPEARRLAELLAELIAERADGDRPFQAGKPPAKWLDDARLLLTRDGKDGQGYSVEQVEYLIRWSQADPFESGVVQSIPKLRERRRILVDKIKKQHNGQAGGRRAPPNTADLDARVERTLRDLEQSAPGPGASDEEKAAYYARFDQEVSV